MQDPKLDELHELAAARSRDELPCDREQDLRAELIEQYLPLIEKMAQAHLLQYTLFSGSQLDNDPDAETLKHVELDVWGAHADDCCNKDGFFDEQIISINGFGPEAGQPVEGFTGAKSWEKLIEMLIEEYRQILTARRKVKAE